MEEVIKIVEAVLWRVHCPRRVHTSQMHKSSSERTMEQQHVI